MSAQLSAKLNRANLPADGGQVFCELDIEGGTQRGQSQQYIAFCIDVSGSMRGDPIENARNAASQVLGSLNDQDYVSLVTYDSSADVEYPATKWGGMDKSDLRNAISNLDTGDYTNISDGLKQCRSELQSLPDSRDVAKSILLLTDAKPNRGQSSESELRGLARELSDSGISVYAAGLGTDYNQDIVRAIAEGSNGEWDHITSPDQIMDFFDRVIYKGSQTVVASPQVQIDPQGIEIGEIYRRQPQVQEVNIDRTGGRLTVGLPNLQNQQTQQLLFRFEAPSGELNTQRTVANIQVTQNNDILQEMDLYVNYVPNAGQYTENDVVRARFADAQARHAASTGDADQASTIIAGHGQTIASQDGQTIINQSQQQIEQLKQADTVVGQFENASQVTKTKRHDGI
jgi:Ca-activated chloride channel family protein